MMRWSQKPLMIPLARLVIPHSYHSHSSEPGKQLFTLTVPLFLLSVGSQKKQEKQSIFRSHNQIKVKQKMLFMKGNSH